MWGCIAENAVGSGGTCSDPADGTYRGRFGCDVKAAGLILAESAKAYVEALVPIAVGIAVLAENF
jgi:hypothetical protein